MYISVWAYWISNCFDLFQALLNFTSGPANHQHPPTITEVQITTHYTLHSGIPKIFFGPTKKSDESRV